MLQTRARLYRHRVSMLDRLERFYDAVPRDLARVEEFGGLWLVVEPSAWIVHVISN